MEEYRTKADPAWQTDVEMYKCAIWINIRLKWKIYSKTWTPFKDGEYLEKPEYILQYIPLILPLTLKH